MCILFTHQLTQAACGDNHDNNHNKNNKYEDKMQKKTNKVARQSTLGKLIWKARRGSPQNPRSIKNDMSVVVNDEAAAWKHSG